MKGKLEYGVESGDADAGQLEGARIKMSPRDEPAPGRVDAIGLADPGVERKGGVDQPAARRDVGRGIDRMRDVVPELGERLAAGKEARHAHDGNRRFLWHG